MKLEQGFLISLQSVKIAKAGNKSLYYARVWNQFEIKFKMNENFSP